jgi:hypothetical protein
VLTPETLETRRAVVTSAGDLPALLSRLRARAQTLLDRMPPVPDVKALLSAEGGICPACGGALLFDPWSPDRHRCTGCGGQATGERQHAHWARAQHLWLAERAAHLALVGVMGDDQRCADRARVILAAYHGRYFAIPNRDNVLGPSHLFFSTYLESMWVLSYLAAATALRARGWLPDDDAEAISAVVEEAATLIGDFNEGLSNRQTWNSAALTAIAAWFGDADLAESAIQGPTGLLGHLTDGFGADGMWYEGENYHLFAVRGLLIGLSWARAAGVDLLANAELAEHFGQAAMAPAATALPDLTFPARRDARFGVSLAHPAYLESWEAALSGLGESAPADLAPWLHALYRAGHRPAATYDAYLHDAGEPDRETTKRVDLSWWMLLDMQPTLPPDLVSWRPASQLLPTQGVAVLRSAERYVSLECGGEASGHGHPDRLHLTVHADGVHWLADPGAGSYVHRDLFWYRSTLAHNAPRLDGRSQDPGPARCLAFEDIGDWAWVQARFETLRRSVVRGPGWLVDVVDMDGAAERLLELAWHFRGGVEVQSPGRWTPVDLEEEFVSEPMVFEPEGGGTGPIRLAIAAGDRTLGALLLGGSLLRARCPGLPGSGEPAVLFLVRTRAAASRLAAVLDWGGGVADATLAGEELIVREGGAEIRIRVAEQSATIEEPGGIRALAGAQTAAGPIRRVLRERPSPVTGEAVRIDQPPSLDGTLDGFDLSAPIELADELHYRRSENPYEGPERFSATAFVNWDERALYLAVDVAKPDVVVRAPNEPPLDLDNEPDDIHSDGIQVYYARRGEPPTGYLIRPAPDGGLWARPIPGGPDEPVELAGASARSEVGYLITVALPCPGLEQQRERPAIEFELAVNEMRPGRVRRAGQLAWSGGGVWVYLRGDRPGPASLGVLRLIG